MRAYMGALAAALVIASGVAAAAEVGDSSMDSCRDISVAQERTAMLRYQGVPMRDLLPKLVTAMCVKFSKECLDLAQSSMAEAYSLPDYPTKDEQVKASREYSDKVYINCIKAYLR